MSPIAPPSRPTGNYKSTLSAEILNAHKDPEKAKTLQLTDRQLVLLISYAYKKNKQPGDLNTSHLKLFEKMFTPGGWLREDRVSKEGPAYMKADGKWFVLTGQNMTLTPAIPCVGAPNGFVKGPDSDSIDFLFLLPIEYDCSIEAMGWGPLRGLSPVAFDMQEAWRMWEEEGGYE